MIKTFIIYSIIDMCLDKLSDIIEGKLNIPILSYDLSKPTLSDFFVGRKFNCLTVEISRNYDPSSNTETIKRWIFFKGKIVNVSFNGVFHHISITYNKKIVITLENDEPSKSHPTQICDEEGFVGLSIDTISAISWEN